MPGDTRPHVARAAKRRKRTRTAGDLADARLSLWQAVKTAEDLLLDAGQDAATTLRAVHALTQACTAYAKLVEAGELEARIAELERAMDARAASGGAGARRAGAYA
jgi:hypothetical protein